MSASLEERLSEAVGLIEGFRGRGPPVKVLFSGGVDGAAAAAIVARALMALKVPFTLRRVGLVAEEGPVRGPAILVEPRGLERASFNAPGDVLVICHHLEGVELDEPPLRLSPGGLDGSIEACCSSMALLVSRRLEAEDEVSGLLACLGVEGDEQVVDGEAPPLRGVNLEALKPLADRGSLRFRRRVRLFAPSRLTAAESIAYTYRPPIPGLTGREDRAQAMASRLGLAGPISSLSPAQLASLVQALVREALASGVEAYEAESIYGQVLEYGGLDVHEESLIADLSVLTGGHVPPITSHLKGRMGPYDGEVLSRALEAARSICRALASPLRPRSLGAVKVFELPSLHPDLAPHVARALAPLHPDGVVAVLRPMGGSVRAVFRPGRRVRWGEEDSVELMRRVRELDGLCWGVRREVEAVLPSGRVAELLRWLGGRAEREG